MLRTTCSALLAVLLGGTVELQAAEFALLGSIEGKVRNNTGAPQMGATVVLLNRNERPVRKAITDIEGEFRFDSLPPESYSVKVNLNTFVPASRGSIQVRAGASSFLNIQLANLFSSIELVYTAPGQTSLLSDDWKWALRTNASTRPVLRFLPGVALPNDGWSSSRSQINAFSDTRGLVRVSAGDNGADPFGSTADLGTAFALATSLFGTSELRFSGNLGFASDTGTPTTGFRAGYSSKSEGSLTPDIELTVRQVSTRAIAGAGLATGNLGTPILRTMSGKLSDRRQLTEAASLDYGVMFESVVFLDRLNILSPFARLNYELGEWGVVAVAYSSGAPARDLMEAGSPFAPADQVLQSELAGLSVFPRVSLARGQARVQRNNTYEAGWTKRYGRRSVSAAFYRDDIRDAALLAGGATSSMAQGELLPDLGSNAYIFNVGRLQSMGYAVSYTEQISENWSGTIGGGSSGALLAQGQQQASAEQLRSNLNVVQRPWGSARISGVLPVTGTRVVTAYMFVPKGTATLPHGYLTQSSQMIPGLNVQLRQPLPAVGGIPGRLELAAEVRNILADGYLSITAPDGRALWLIPFPRTFRGGVSFIF